MKLDIHGHSARLVKLALAAAALGAGISAHALTFTTTAPDYVGAANPPATQTVASFSFTAGVLSLMSPSNISSILISGVWGGGAYQTGAGNFVTAPTRLTVDGITVGTCGPYDECSAGYNPTYEGDEGFSYTFTSAQYGALLSSLGSGGLNLVANLASPYSSNYANTLSSLSLTVTTGAVAAVPEPETYALMLAGLCCVGLLARRHRTPAARGR